MKKIIIFNAGFLIYGAERGLINLIRVLKDRYEITVVLPKEGPLVKRLKNVSSAVDIKIYPLPVLMFSISPLYYIKYIFLYILNICYFSYYIKSNRIDMICTNSLLLTAPGVIGKITRTRHIWHVREFFSSGTINSILGKIVAAFSDLIVCQSETIKNKLFANNGASVIYEPLNSCDYKTYDVAAIKKELNFPAEAKIITIVSRLHPLKGQYEFLEEMRDFLKEHKNLYLVVVGDISPRTLRSRRYRSKIRELVETNGLGNVVLAGFREDVDKFFSVSDVCVFPFRREEPFGVSVAEALAYKKVAFFPRSGGAKEVYNLFKEGEEFNVEAVKEMAVHLNGNLPPNPKELNIPQNLSFSAFKDKVLPLFK